MTNNIEKEEEEEPWIEDKDADSDDDDDDDYEAGANLFSTDHRDPKDIFRVPLTTAKDGEPISIQLTGIKAKYPHLLQSTGMTLWKGSQNLCHYLLSLPTTTTAAVDADNGTGDAEDNAPDNQQQEFSLVNKTVVELGAGLGLCGIVAHRHAQARLVILTDGDTATLANQRQNVALNCGLNDTITKKDNTILCKQLLWGKQVAAFCDKYSTKGFDVVMGGDVAYAQEALGILMETAVGLMARGRGVFVLSFCFRGGVTIQHVLECAVREHDLEWKQVWPIMETANEQKEETQSNCHGWSRETTVPDTAENKDNHGEGVYMFRQKTTS